MNLTKSLGLSVLLLVSIASHAAESDAVQLARLSQAFSDASASGDAKTLAKLLDDKVVFMGEDGSLSSKKDIVASAAPPPAGAHNQLVQSDFQVTLHGDTAVTSFTDNASYARYGYVARDRFRSTEVWMKQNGEWKIISSQTLEVPVPPPFVNLPPASLDQYVGSYAMAPGHSIRIERDDHQLRWIGVSGKPELLQAEAPDVMFSKDQPRARWVFQRDTQGHIAGFAVRRAGHDMQWFKREN